MKTSGPCRFAPSTLCGVVRNQKNCTFHNNEGCQDKSDHTVSWLAAFEDPKIMLQLVRYNLKKVPITIIEDQMCIECRVIWADPITCPICNME